MERSEGRSVTRSCTGFASYGEAVVWSTITIEELDALQISSVNFERSVLWEEGAAEPTGESWSCIISGSNYWTSEADDSLELP